MHMYLSSTTTALYHEVYGNNETKTKSIDTNIIMFLATIKGDFWDTSCIWPINENTSANILKAFGIDSEFDSDYN